MGSLSIWHWLIVLVVVVLIFGTKKLRNLGGDVGGAVKGFKDAMSEEKNKAEGVASVSSHEPEASLRIASTATEVPVAKAPAKKRAPAAKKPAAAKSAASKSTATKAATKKTSPTVTSADKPKTSSKKPSAAKPKA